MLFQPPLNVLILDSNAAVNVCDCRMCHKHLSCHNCTKIKHPFVRRREWYYTLRMEEVFASKIEEVKFTSYSGTFMKVRLFAWYAWLVPS